MAGTVALMLGVRHHADDVTIRVTCEPFSPTGELVPHYRDQSVWIHSRLLTVPRRRCAARLDSALAALQLLFTAACPASTLFRAGGEGLATIGSYGMGVEERAAGGSAVVGDA
jgi:hypothetical protein